jgi:hypothetical protein
MSNEYEVTWQKDGVPPTKERVEAASSMNALAVIKARYGQDVQVIGSHQTRFGDRRDDERRDGRR